MKWSSDWQKTKLFAQQKYAQTIGSRLPLSMDYMVAKIVLEIPHAKHNNKLSTYVESACSVGAVYV